ncbi:MAG: alpha-L-fucosidase [Sphingomonadaceae bacterium]
MKRMHLMTLALLLPLLASAADPIPYAHVHVVAPGDSAAVITDKAAKVLPRPVQTDWMRLERTFFLHFGVNTFNQVEWGSGREQPSIFNPSALDATQWLRTVQQFDGKMLVLVAKHHDGFAMWPSQYTAHTLAASPWRGGKGDLVREVATAARSAGVKLGIYLSPADLYQLHTNPANPAGYYGNGSARQTSTIPTDPASFQRDPSKGRAPAPGFGTFRYDVDDYNRYFLNQLYELLTAYGPVHEVWFDGANPDPSVTEHYDYAAWYDLIRKLQPQAVIMGKGPDVRWVGTESGYGRTTEWSVVPLPTAPAQFDWPDMQAADLGSRTQLAQLKPGAHLWWYPAETNVTALANGQWFWAANKKPRPVAQLVDIYYASVGRNSNLILNLSPDQRGLLPDDQVTALAQVAEILRATFATNLAAGATVSTNHAAAQHPARVVLDGNLDTWWEAAPGRTDGTLTLRLPKPVRFDVVSLQEAVDQRGQRIESLLLETWDGKHWVSARPVASDTLTTVGHRRLLRLDTPVTTSGLRVRITGARLAPTLAEVGLYLQAADLLPPAIADRAADGSVRISHAAGGTLVYTTDGSEPTRQSARVNGPVAVPTSGVVKAARVLDDGRLGVIGVRNFLGLSPRGWTVVAVGGADTQAQRDAAALAIDGDPATFWETHWPMDTPLPHTVTIDMGQTERIAGLVYQPRQDGQLNGTVEHFRFTALDDVWHNGWTSAAELTVIAADGQ